MKKLIFDLILRTLGFNFIFIMSSIAFIDFFAPQVKVVMSFIDASVFDPVGALFLLIITIASFGLSVIVELTTGDKDE